MSRRQRIKKSRKVKTREDKRLDLQKQVQKEVNKVNSMLKSLERNVKSGTWSSRKLRNRLNSITLQAWSNNRVKLKSNMTVTQLKAVQKALQQFRTSKTSTYKGIKQVAQQTVKSLHQQFSIETDNLTLDDFENIYNLFGEDEFKDLTSKIPSSDIIVLLTDSKEYNYSDSQFINMLDSLIDVEDNNIRETALSLYNKLM